MFNMHLLLDDARGSFSLFGSRNTRMRKLISVAQSVTVFKSVVIRHKLAPGPLARSNACPPGNQTFTGSIPGPAHSFVEIWS